MNELFRFVNIRPPRKLEPSASISLISLHPASALVAALRVARRGSNDALASMQRIAGEHFESHPDDVVDSVTSPFLEIYQLLVNDDAPTPDALQQAVQDKFGQTPESLVSSGDYKDTIALLIDSLTAIQVLHDRQRLHNPLSNAVRVIFVIRRLVEQDLQLSGSGGIHRYLALPLLLPDGIFPLPAEQSMSNPSTSESPSLGPDKAIEAEAKLQKLSRAYDELIALQPSVIEIDSRDDSRPVSERFRFLPPKTIDRLSVSTRDVLKELQLDESHLSLNDATSVLRQQSSLHSLAASAYRRKIVRVVSHAGTLLGINVHRDLPTSAKVANLPMARNLGIGELLVVKERLVRYELDEIEHIDNIMATARHEKKFRRLHRLEETETFEFDSEREDETSLETTDRFELHREVNATQRTEAKLDAGVKISGKYGQVNFEGHTSVGFKASGERTEKTAVQHSREVVEKTRQRVFEKSRQERVRKILDEVEATETSELDNSGGAQHVHGVFQWLNKVHEVKLLSYGKRMLLEFLVPEPAAFFLYQLATDPPEGMTFERPEPFDLLPDDIGAANYKGLAAAYGAAAVEPPPSETIYIAHAFKFDAMTSEQKDYFETDVKMLDIPDGYETRIAYVNVQWGVTDPTTKQISTEEESPNPPENPEPYPYVRFSLGGRAFDLHQGEAGVVRYFAARHQIAAAATVHYRGAMSISIDIECRRTDEFYDRWKYETYERIQIAYEAMKSQYDDAIKSLSLMQEQQWQALRPEQYREIEKTELRRGAISLLTRSRFDNSNGMAQDSLGYPQIAHTQMEQIGPYVQFFENAFEWDQMTYIFYPYFWASKSRWVELRRIVQDDAAHQAFLQAGMARIVVPVRPGFEESISYFLDTGHVWIGEDPLDYNTVSPPYLPVIAELRDAVDRLDLPDEIECWEETLPVALRWLRDEQSLPEWPPSPCSN